MHYVLIYMRDPLAESGEGWAKIFKNKRRLAEATDNEIGYGKLVYHFTRMKRDWFTTQGFLVVKVVGDIQKGLHGAGQAGNLIPGGLKK